MSGHHPFSELTKNFPPERQARVAEKVQLLKQEMALAELRKARYSAAVRYAYAGPSTSDGPCCRRPGG